MTNHAGLCIGGPLDGKRLASQRDSHRVEERSPLPPLSEGPSPIPVNLKVKTHEYRWTTLFGVGIWVAHGLDPRDVAESLLLCYEQAHKA